MRLTSYIIPASIMTVLSCNMLRAQNISEIAQSDPLIITGAIGTQNTYRYSSSGNTYGSPMSNTVYANLDISLYGFSMPFSFYYSNDNLNFSYPQFSFNLSPSYKNWTGHIGQSSMPFSSYVMNMSFNGVGLEYNSDKLRTGIFYGILRKAVNGDPNDPMARTPQYKRVGWGFKVGYGSSRNFVDLYLLRAYDRPNSIDEACRQYVAPQENIVVGLHGCVTPLHWLSFTTNVAASAFNTDSRAEKLKTKEGENLPFDKVFDTRYSSLMRFAGDANINFMLSGLTASVSYRMVQPDYTSLGTYYMSNNYHSLGINLSTTLLKKIALSANFSGQEDNLTNKQLYTTQGYVYSAMASSRLNNHISISAAYNGYTQRQSNGTAVVTDSTRVHRQMNSFSLTPSYMFDTESFGHNISLTANYTENLDKNHLSAQKNDVETMAIGLSYGLDIKPWDTDVTATVSHQQTKGYKSKYVSEVGSVDIGRSFLSEKNLHLSIGGSICYNHITRQSKNLSLGAQCSASYTYNKKHIFGASASFNKYGDVNMIDRKSDLDCTDITCSLNYTYNFTLFEIKKKVKSEK